MIDSTEYRNWITQNRKKNGLFYDCRYADNCVTSLNTLLNHIGLENYHGKKTIFEFDNPIDFKTFMDYLDANVSYKVFDKSKHYRYSNALKFFNGFLLENENISKIKDDPYVSIVIEKTEGSKKSYYTSRYERNAKLRKKAIQIHSPVCCVCGFDFEKKYGELGKNYIEVHHIRPLYTLEEEVVVNPEIDLVCVCANCHRMIHHKKDSILSIDELKTLVDENKV